MENEMFMVAIRELFKTFICAGNLLFMAIFIFN